MTQFLRLHIKTIPMRIYSLFNLMTFQKSHILFLTAQILQIKRIPKLQIITGTAANGSAA